MYFSFSLPVYHKATFVVGVLGQNCNLSHWTEGIWVPGSTILLTSHSRSGTDMATAKCCCLHVATNVGFTCLPKFIIATWLPFVVIPKINHSTNFFQFNCLPYTFTNMFLGFTRGCRRLPVSLQYISCKYLCWLDVNYSIKQSDKFLSQGTRMMFRHFICKLLSNTSILGLNFISACI